MSEEKMENELIQAAMQIILHAGDARIKIQEALDCAKQFDFDCSHQLLDEAKECIREAHSAQTSIIQNETRGKSYDPSLLFNHAQDTLMTIMSELNMAIEMIAFFAIISEKIELK